ncbi:MAG: hypothetical protein Q3X95_06315 [Duodenibacillus sp.]|nr:hypothetical protein [Duodenibacillus sp.]
MNLELFAVRIFNRVPGIFPKSNKTKWAVLKLKLHQAGMRTLPTQPVKGASARPSTAFLVTDS